MSNFRNIVVTPQSKYLPDQSNPMHQKFVWSYEITITNNSDEIVQLLHRHWIITDLTGHVQEVRGPGVVGKQPIIRPEQNFTYTSFCQLITPQGIMEGEYEFQNLNEEHFKIKIPRFILTAPIAVTKTYRTKLH